MADEQSRFCEVAKILLDKLVIAAIVAVIGSYVASRVNEYQSQLNAANNLRLELIRSQLNSDASRQLGQ